jgi:hypothetical protein
MYAMAVPNSKLIVLNPVIIIDQKTIRKAELIFAQINVLSQRRRSASVPRVTQRQRGDFSTCNLQDRRRSGPFNLDRAALILGHPANIGSFQHTEYIGKSSMKPRNVNREGVACRVKTQRFPAAV